MLSENEIYFLLNTIDTSLYNSDTYPPENTLNYIYNYLKNKIGKDNTLNYREHDIKKILDNNLDYISQIRNDYKKNPNKYKNNNKNITYLDIYFS